MNHIVLFYLLYMFGPKKTCLNKRWRTLQNNAIAIRHICNLARLAPCAPQSICFYIKHIFLYCSFLPESYPHVVWPTIAAAEAGEVARGRGRDEEVGLPRLELKLPWRRRKISKERYFQAQLFLVNLCLTLSLCHRDLDYSVFVSLSREFFFVLIMYCTLSHILGHASCTQSK